MLVVHLDLYLSNIMWRVDEHDDRMRIKIIDWIKSQTGCGRHSANSLGFWQPRQQLQRFLGTAVTN